MKRFLLVLPLACSTAVVETAPPEAPEEYVPRPVPSLSPTDREKPASCGDEWLAASTGRVSDDTGRSVLGARVGYCTYDRESGVCLPFVTTEKGGWFSLVVTEERRCVTKLSVRVIPPTGSRLSEGFCAPKLKAKEGVFDLESDLRLYRLGAPTKLPPKGNIAEARTVEFAEGLSVTFAPDDVVETDQYENLSAGPIASSERPCFLDAGQTLDALYAFGPSMNVAVFADRPKVRFTLPNPKRLAEGTAVDLFVLGGSGSMLDTETPIEEGKLVKSGSGRVEGGVVVPDPGSELSVLSAVGYARK